MKKMFKKRHQNEEMTLQITAMADIFTVLLVFLLKSFATSAVTITPSAGVNLPQAKADPLQEESLKLEISPTAVLVEGNPVVSLSASRFDPKEIDSSNGTSRTLSAALEKQRARQLMIAKVNPDVKVDSKIMVIADQHTPYATIKQVLASAAVQGYTDFKMATVTGE